MKNQQRILLLLVIIAITIVISIFSNDWNMTISRITRIDSIGHMIGFFALAWFLFLALKLPTINLSLCLIFYSALTELGQLYLGFRNAEISDFIADLVGISLFMLMRWTMMIYGNKAK